MVLVVDDIDHLQRGLRFVATVGVFDGVHLGHSHVLGRLRELADQLGAAPVAITFDPHPQAVITGRVPDLICDPFEKLARMADAGAAAIVVQRFDEAFRAQTAEEFLERLARGRDLAGLVMSHESAFGRDRQGTVDTVRRLAARDGFRLVEVDTLEVDGEPISSSRIRAAVAAGDLATAERLLGRRYAVTGTVACDAEGGWALAPNGAVVLPPPGTYAVKASWHVDPEPEEDGRPVRRGSVRAVPFWADPLLPNEVGLGAAGLDGDMLALDVLPAPIEARGACVRVQFVAYVGDAPVRADDPVVAGVLDAAREGTIAIRFHWDEEWEFDESTASRGDRLPSGVVPPAGGWAMRAHDVGTGRPRVTATSYVASWPLAGSKAGLIEQLVPGFNDLDAALAWARARARGVSVCLPDVWPAVGGGATWIEWSAGDDPIDGLPPWVDRRPGEG